MAPKKTTGSGRDAAVPPVPKVKKRKPSKVAVRPRGVAQALGAIAESGDAEALASALGVKSHAFKLTFRKGEPVFEIKRQTFQIMKSFIKKNPALLGEEATKSRWDCDDSDPYTICW